MDITLEERESRKGLKQLRREKFIPAVVYDKNRMSVSVKLELKVFEEHTRKMEEGGLATVRFNLTLGKETFTAFVKDISYHRTSYQIQHIDFMRVTDSDRITIYVPIVLKGVDKCKGTNEGGQLKRVKRSVKINCLVSEVPEHFVLDVEDIALGEQIRVSNLTLTPSMKLKIHEKQVLVSVTK